MPTNDSHVRRILFVDDEAAILAGFERVLRPLRNELESDFVRSPAEALARLAREPFDIVISDIRMPLADGSALLEDVQRLYPHIIRIALSGSSDIRVAMRTIPVAHQFLTKPCDAKTLRSVIQRVVKLQELLNDRQLQTMAAGMSDLPARPKTYTLLCKQLADPNTRASDVADVICRDVAMAANLLKFVNSAFFGLRRRVSSIEAAIGFLGMDVLRSLVVAKAAAVELGPRACERGYDLELNEAHAILQAKLAMQLFTDKNVREDAFMAALLSNIGELLLVAEGPDSALAARDHASRHSLPLDAAERELGVVSHAHVGAYLLGTWGLPPDIVEAVAYHHEPGALAHDALELVDAVNAAASVADHYLFGLSGGLERAEARLSELGGAEAFAKLRTEAERLHRQASTERSA